jgi:hypothetical protein
MKKNVIIILFFIPLVNWAQSGLFDSDSVLQITLKGDIRSLMNDRDDIPKEHPLSLGFTNQQGQVFNIDISSRTRGNFRRKLGGCTYPPIMLLFNDLSSIQNTLFSEQRKLKLVVPCSGDEYVVREYMAYKIYNLLTPLSFKARLVSVVLDDTKRNKRSAPFYGILLEEEHQMAVRNNLVSVERKIAPRQAETSAFHRMAMFEYLIANTDWSVEYLQNVKLMAKDSLAISYTVPYDFDHAGLVSAPYAKPAEELRLSSVRERRYRGYCLADLGQLDSTIAEFNRIREKIITLYESATYLDASSKRSALKFIDDFYAVINDPSRRNRDFSYPCDKNGTGNVIISGLKGEQ